MAQQLYFMSDLKYQVGHRLGDYDLIYENIEIRREYDEKIDAHSPFPTIKRHRSIIAFKTPYECIYHAQKSFFTNIFQGFTMYTIVSDMFHKAPFATLELLFNHFHHRHIFDTLIREYWNPTHNWVCFEYLCQYAFIKATHEVPVNQEELDIVHFSHQSDLQSAKKKYAIET